jgi:hypothetical protein
MHRVHGPARRQHVRPDPGLSQRAKDAAYNWGFVAGKSNTIYPWDSWQKPYPQEPKVWFHDIFRTTGEPFDPKEVEYIRRITSAAQGDKE